MKKLMVAIAGAVAMACSAFADTPMLTWFDGGVAAGFPTDKTMTGGAWDADAADKGEWTGSAVEISANDEPLTFTADEEKTIAFGKSVLVDTTVTFTPFTEENMPAAPENAKAGAIVVDGYLYLLNEDGWQESDIEVAENQPVGIKVELKKMGSSYEAFYYINGSTAPSDIIMLFGQEAPTVQTVNFTGDGAVSALSAQCEAQLVEFTIADVANATKEVTGADEVGGTTYESYEGTDVKVTYTANPGYFFAGGSKTAVVNAKAAEDITITTETATVKAAAKIGSEYYYTLKQAFDAVADDQTIKLWSDSTSTETATSTKANVTLDLNGFKYTYTADSYLMSVTGGGLMIKDSTGNGELLKTGKASVFNVTNSTLNLESGTLHYNGQNAESSSGVIVNVRSTGSFTMDGGKLWVENKYKQNAIRSANTKAYAVCVIDGFVDGGLELKDNGVITLTGGVYTVDPTDYVAEGWYAWPNEPEEGQWTVKNEAPAAKVGTKWYLTLMDAINEADIGDTVTLLAAASSDDVWQLDKAITLDLNGFSFTVPESETFTVNANLEVINGVAGQGGLVMQGNIVASAEVDIYSLPVAAGGLVPKQGGSITITAFGIVKFPSAWANKTANQLEANTPGFLKDTEDGATIITGKEYVYSSDAACWLVDGAVAKAIITNAKTSQPMAETYTTLDAAIAAANVGTTVTLCANITTDAKAAFAIDKNLTLDFADYTVTKTVANDYTFDIKAGATVVFDGGEGGIVQAASSATATSPAAAIRNKGNLTIAGGVYTSDVCIIKNDEDPGAGVLTVDGGTFNIVAAAPEMKQIPMALMNWATATINGGTWNGTIGTRSCDGNAVSKFGVTTITVKLEGDSVDYLLYVGYPGDTTYANVPKITGEGIDKDTVKLGQVTTITDELELFEDGDYISVRKASAPSTPSWIDPSDTTNAALYDAWAETYGVTDPAGAKQDAFLFNVANNDEAIEEAKEDFTLEITFDDDGNPVVACENEDSYNGTVVLWGKAALTDDEWHAKETGDQFFKATLELIPAN